MYVNSSTRPKYLVIKGRAGFGNRLSVLAHGIVQAMVTGRTLVVDWRDKSYSDGATNVFDLFFAVSGRYCGTSPEALVHRSVFPSIWENHLHLSVVDYVAKLRQQHGGLEKSKVESLLGINQGMTNLVADSDVVVAWGYGQYLLTIPKEWRRREFGVESAPAVLRTVFQQHLQLHPSIRTRAERFLSGTSPSDLVGVHVRDGDKPLTLPLEHCFARIDRLLSEMARGVFLATDSAAVLQAFKSRYRERLVFLDKWLPPAAQGAHQNPACPDRTENGIAALVDLYILSQCGHLLYQHDSTFSQVATYLTKAPQERRCSWLE